MKNPFIKCTQENNLFTIEFHGDWKQSNADILEKIIFPDNKYKSVTFDFLFIGQIDTFGAFLINESRLKYEHKKIKVEYKNLEKNKSNLFDICKRFRPESLDYSSNGLSFLNIYESFMKAKKWLVSSFFTTKDFLGFMGESFYAIKDSILHPSKIRISAIFYHIQTSGMAAIPIIILTSFLIGIVIAYQGAVQLEQFGANIFIVEMVTIASIRELAPMLSAIVIAGRSASAFSAQIGVMKITDEVDAMRTMGFEPWHFLTMPRVFGLIISMPLIVLCANMLSVFGGMVVASTKLGISMDQFLIRMQETVNVTHFYIGMIKAPIFGWIIAMIGCFRGFQISSSTESVGKYTTISVVNAIFWVIAFNAAFSVFLTEMGW